MSIPWELVSRELAPGKEPQFRVFQRAVVDENGCWRYQGHHNYGGYGVLRWRGRTQKAHRVAWEITRGPIPEGMLVCHRCDVRDCVNPQHLFLGTHDDNMQDRDAKGRARLGSYRGERHHSARLTCALAREVWSRKGTGTQEGVAREFGVGREVIRKVWEGKTWKHAIDWHPEEG